MFADWNLISQRSRYRNIKDFEEIVDKIRAIDLKKPITFAERSGDDGDPRYVLLPCQQAVNHR